MTTTTTKEIPMDIQDAMATHITTTKITLALTEKDVDRLRTALTTRYAELSDEKRGSLSEEARAAFDIELAAIDDLIRALRAAALASIR